MRALLCTLLLATTGCLTYASDGTYRCDAAKGTDCEVCNPATRWCRNYSLSIDPATAWNLRGVWGSGPSDVWAVGDDGAGGPVAIHWDGATWSRAALPAGTGALRAISGSARDHVVAVGAGGTVVDWNGAAWRLVHDGAGQEFTAVAAESATVFWYGDSAGTVYRRDDASGPPSVTQVGGLSVAVRGLAVQAGNAVVLATDIGPYRATFATPILTTPTFLAGTGDPMVAAWSSGDGTAWFARPSTPNNLANWDGTGLPASTSPGSVKRLAAVAARDNGSVWVAGEETPPSGAATGGPYAAVKKGAVWTLHAPGEGHGPAGPLAGLAVFLNDEVFAVGAGGLILHRVP